MCVCGYLLISFDSAILKMNLTCQQSSQLMWHVTFLFKMMWWREISKHIMMYTVGDRVPCIYDRVFRNSVLLALIIFQVEHIFPYKLIKILHICLGLLTIVFLQTYYISAWDYFHRITSIETQSSLPFLAPVLSPLWSHESSTPAHPLHPLVFSTVVTCPQWSYW